MARGGILKQYIEDWAKSAGKYQQKVDAYNNSYQRGGNGEPVQLVFDRAPRGNIYAANADAVMAGSTKLRPMGYSSTEYTIEGTPAMQFGDGKNVLYVDYGSAEGVGSQKIKGEKFYYYAGRKPEGLKAVGGNFSYISPEQMPSDGAGLKSGTYYLRGTDESGNQVVSRYDGRVQAPEGETDAWSQMGQGGEYQLQDGRWAVGRMQMTHNGLPGKPAAFTQRPPSFTQAQQRQMLEPERAKALAMQMRGGGGIIEAALKDDRGVFDDKQD